MANETLAPDALLDSTGYTGGSLADIDEDPASPDGAWLTTSSNVSTICHTSFPTPSGSLTGQQSFRVLLRKTNHSTDPTFVVELYESNALVSTVIASTTLSSTTGQVFTGNFDASAVTNMANVECRVVGTPGGGNPGNRASVEVGAVAWDVQYSTGQSSSASTTISASLSASGSVIKAGSTTGSLSTDITTSSTADDKTIDSTLAIRQIATGQVSNGTATANLGASTAIDDVLVVVGVSNYFSLSSGFGPPSGGGAGTWTLHTTADLGTNNAHMRVWTKTCAQAGSQNITLDTISSEECGIAVFVMSGADTTDHLEDSASALFTGVSGTPSQHPAPSVTAETDGGILISAVITETFGGVGTYTPPTGMTENWDLTLPAPGDPNQWTGANKQLSASGATGTQTFNYSAGSVDGCGVSLIVRPAIVQVPAAGTTISATASLAGSASKDGLTAGGTSVGATVSATVDKTGLTTGSLGCTVGISATATKSGVTAGPLAANTALSGSAIKAGVTSSPVAIDLATSGDVTKTGETSALLATSLNISALVAKAGDATGALGVSLGIDGDASGSEQKTASASLSIDTSIGGVAQKTAQSVTPLVVSCALSGVASTGGSSNTSLVVDASVSGLAAKSAEPSGSIPITVGVSTTVSKTASSVTGLSVSAAVSGATSASEAKTASTQLALQVEGSGAVTKFGEATTAAAIGVSLAGVAGSLRDLTFTITSAGLGVIDVSSGAVVDPITSVGLDSRTASTAGLGSWTVSSAGVATQPDPVSGAVGVVKVEDVQMADLSPDVAVANVIQGVAI